MNRRDKDVSHIERETLYDPNDHEYASLRQFIIKTPVRRYDKDRLPFEDIPDIISEIDGVDFVIIQKLEQPTLIISKENSLALLIASLMSQSSSLLSRIISRLASRHDTE